MLQTKSAGYNQSMNTETLVLATASERRISLIRNLGFTVCVQPADIDESIFDHLEVHERVLALAERKASTVAGLLEDSFRWILGADTLVELPASGETCTATKTLGKPESYDEAVSMLRLLSGREHLVHSGLSLFDKQTNSHVSRLNTTRVYFSALSENEIKDYLAMNQWEGVAGAYRIQEHGAFFISRIDGSYSSVMGLPIHDFYVILRSCGFAIPGMSL